MTVSPGPGGPDGPGGGSSSRSWSSPMSADQARSPVPEPGDDDRAGRHAEAAGGGATEGQLEAAHGSGIVGRADVIDPARRRWRRGRTSVRVLGLRGDQGDAKRGVVRMCGKPNGRRMRRDARSAYRTRRAGRAANLAASQALIARAMAGQKGIFMAVECERAHPSTSRRAAPAAASASSSRS